MLMWRIGNACAPMISDRNVSEAASPCSTLVLAAFLVIEHELQRDARVVRPARMRRMCGRSR